MPSILEQLGVPTNIGEEGQGIISNAVMTEATAPTNMAGLEELGDTLIAGAVLLLEQAFAIFGASNEKGKSIMKTLKTIEKIISNEKLDLLKKQAVSVLSPVASPAGAGMAMPEAKQPQPTGKPEVSLEDIERLLRER